MDLVQEDGETPDSAQREMGSVQHTRGENRQSQGQGIYIAIQTLAKANSCLLASLARFISAAVKWE